MNQRPSKPQDSLRTQRPHLGWLLHLVASIEALLGFAIVSVGLLGLRSFFIHSGRNLTFLFLVSAITLIGIALLVAASRLHKRRYWGQLCLFLVPLVPFLLIATD